MKNRLNRIIVFFMLLSLTACFSSERNNDKIDNNVEDVIKNEALNEIENQFKEFDILVTTQAINIRKTHEIKDDNKVGLACMGEKYTVREAYQDNDYIWYKIGDDKWIANDGTWCVIFDNSSKQYPHVLSEKEKSDFLNSIETGGQLASNYYEDKRLSLVLFSNPELYGADIIFFIESIGIDDVYEYDINYVVKNNENEYLLFLETVSNNEFEDYSLGCIKMQNIGYIKSAEGSEHFNFDATFIKNNNNVANEFFNKIFNVKLNYYVSGQVAM